MAHQDPTWTVLADYQGHQINASGQVRNINTGKVMQMSVNQNGVQYVSIRNTTINKYENPTVGVLVASTFINGHTNDESTVLHLDGNTLNNHAENLMWATRWHAMAYHREITSLDTRKLRHQILDGAGHLYNNIKDAAMATGCLPSAIDYAAHYNDTLASDEHINFVHKTWPGGHVFRTAK
jgi:hypothetical protein